MEQHLFRYQLVRHIADLRRMEPQNFGVIVQSRDTVRWKYNQYFGRQSGFDRANFHEWKAFFNSEIYGKAVPLFQPERTSVEFLEYLQNQTRGNYSVTRPLEIVMSTGDIEAVLNYLFQTLVWKPEDKPKIFTRPVSLFRDELVKRGLENNPALMRNKGFALPGERKELVQYQYVRNHGADMPVLIQTVPWSNQIQDTKGRLESALAIARILGKTHVKAELAIVIDKPTSLKTEEKDDEGRALLRERFISAPDEFKEAMGNTDNLKVANNVREVGALSDSVQRDLQEIEEEANSRNRTGELAL